jgi:hypothetical protein
MGEGNPASPTVFVVRLTVFSVRATEFALAVLVFCMFFWFWVFFRLATLLSPVGGCSIACLMSGVAVELVNCFGGDYFCDVAHYDLQPYYIEILSVFEI